MSDWATEGAVVVSALAGVAIAVFAWLTWKVYRQIKGVMEESFESEFRPVIHAAAKPTRSREGWSAHLRVKNVGKGVAHRIRFRIRNAANDQPGEWSDPDEVLGDLVPGEEAVTRTHRLNDNVPRFDVGYQDLFGNEFVTELRGRLLRFARVERSSP